jgi:hypothetical protein
LLGSTIKEDAVLIKLAQYLISQKELITQCTMFCVGLKVVIKTMLLKFLTGQRLK